ncbi:MAG: dioxygenase [Sulfurovum sp.]|nr:MAG: dioxygenase [Sulfurovum sp.]
MRSLFHLAYNVRNLEETRAFYKDLLGCNEGRSTETWVDFDFFGHQLSLHLGEPFKVENTGRVGDYMVAMPHLGVILEMPEWNALAKRLENAQMKFIIAPTLRFAGEVGEQSTMFFTDPSGNPIEIKGFASLDSVFDA